ncbi:MAG: hypothetical protein EOM68_30420, partial [Spirochaetia bacterium]|nr:hypothetical protein [Spirochaetia bacterium]
MRKASAICKVSVASISRWARSSCPKARTKRQRGTLSDALVGSVRAFLMERTRCSSLEVVQFIKQSWGFGVSRQLAHAIIRRLGFTYKRTRKRGGGARIRKATREFLVAYSEALERGNVVSVD